MLRQLYSGGHFSGGNLGRRKIAHQGQTPAIRAACSWSLLARPLIERNSPPRANLLSIYR